MNHLFALFLGLALMLASVYAAVDDPYYHDDDDDEEKVVTRDRATREAIDPNIPRIFYIPDEYVEIYADLSTTLYPRSFQIPTAGLSDPKFKASGGTANVSTAGLVQPLVTTWYCTGGLCSTRTDLVGYDRIKHDYYPGVANISVTDGGVTQYYLVNVTDYSEYYAYNRMSDILSQIIQDGMTEYQKLEAITRWFAENTDYGVNNTAAAVMILDSGNYYGLSKALAGMAQMAGINATTRRASQDPGEYRAQNVLAMIDGRFIVADAGFNEKSKTRPREYALYELDQGFTMNGNNLVQYDGWNKTVIIPSIVNNSEVKVLGKSTDYKVFVNNVLEEVYFPATLTNIITGCFDHTIETLRRIIVDPLNEVFATENGVLYKNNMTTLVLAPRTLEEPVTIHPNTTTLGVNALAYRQQPKLVIPSHVTYLSRAAFLVANITDLTIEPGVTTVGEVCFRSLTSTKVVLPDTVTTMDAAPFSFAKVDEIVLSSRCVHLPEALFQYSTVKKVVIPHGVSYIARKDFADTKNLVNLTLPKSVKIIAKEAFSSTSVKNIFFEGTRAEWCNISISASMPRITVYFSDGENASATEACNQGGSVIENPENPENTTHLSGGTKQMISAIWILFSICLCLVLH